MALVRSFPPLSTRKPTFDDFNQLIPICHKLLTGSAIEATQTNGGNPVP